MLGELGFPPSGCWSGGHLLTRPLIEMSCWHGWGPRGSIVAAQGGLHCRWHGGGQHRSPWEHEQGFSHLLWPGHIFCLRISGYNAQRSLDWKKPQTPVEVSLHLVRRDLSLLLQCTCLETVLCSLSSKSKHSDKAFRNTALRVELIHTEYLLFNFFCHFFGEMNSQHTSLIVWQLHINHVIARCSNRNWQLTCTESVTYHDLKLRELCDKIKCLHASRQHLQF